ncbi:MAG TPA: prolyl oligopeptidase family serine peptidase [Noviherbaspirillum sp.]|nr:prolyl oligopeptidase family serine peptidase [Noviherbaspirillum sp.]
MAAPYCGINFIHPTYKGKKETDGRVSEKTPRYRVVRTPLKVPEVVEAEGELPPKLDVAGAEEVLPQQPDVVVGLHATQKALYVHTSWPEGDRLLSLASKDQTSFQEVPLPFKGFIAEVHAGSSSPDLTIKLQSPIESPRIYTHRPGKQVTDTELQKLYSKQFSGLDWRIVWTEKEDSTRIPFSVLHGSKLGPSQLEIYAAYNNHPDCYGRSGPHVRGFDPQTLEQVEEYGLVDIHAYVEGGGVLGHDWYEQGVGTNKPVAWESLHQVGHKIGDLGIAKPVVSLVSAAGRLAPGVLARPDLFAGLVLDVATLDGVKAYTVMNPTAPFNIPEAGGTADTARGFNTMQRIHLYPQNLPSGEYMPVLGIGRLGDARVGLGQLLKTIALAQERNTGDADILLFVTDGGHVIADLEQLDARTVVIQTFVLRAGGHPDFQLAV